jgi:hypothetical protein
MNSSTNLAPITASTIARSGILLPIFLPILVFGYINRPEQDLSWLTSDDCEADELFQLCRSNLDSDPYLRQIDRDNQVIAISDLLAFEEDGNFSYQYDIYWITNCQFGTAIETDKKYSDGEPILAYCVQDDPKLNFDTALTVGVILRSPRLSRIEYDFGGFSASFDFSSANFSPLEQDITVRRARPVEDFRAEREERFVAEARIEEERLAAVARAEEERLAAVERIENCQNEEDLRYQELIRNFDLAKQNSTGNENLNISCSLQGEGDIDYCIPLITIKNSSTYTLRGATVSYGTKPPKASCEAYLSDITMNFSDVLQPSETATQRGPLVLAPSECVKSGIITSVILEQPIFTRRLCE